MSDQHDDQDQGAGSGSGVSRSTPIAAIAGAVVLAGLVGFALYRRAQAPATPAAPEAAAAPAADASTPADASRPEPPPDDPDAPRGAPEPAPKVKTLASSGPVPPAGATPIVAQSPIRLSPEANILAERYRCVCGCNDPLGLCTCTLARGSEEMKTALKGLADQHLLPEEVDREMTARFGAAALLTNPAPPQTQPSHVTGTRKKS